MVCAAFTEKPLRQSAGRYRLASSEYKSSAPFQSSTLRYWPGAGKNGLLSKQGTHMAAASCHAYA